MVLQKIYLIKDDGSENTQSGIKTTNIIHTSQEREEEAGGDYVAVIYGRKYPDPWYRGDTWI